MTKLLREHDIAATSVSRRASLSALGVLALASPTLEGCGARRPRVFRNCNDSDPGDPIGYGRTCREGSNNVYVPPSGAGGCTDSDPSDVAGQGIRCGAPSCTDSDPNDPGGGGRHCG